MFLRVRREAVTPAEAGLPAGPRRRAAGLRRSEVAALAGVSVEYVTRLEQGRDRRPSVQVLSTLADALRLTQQHPPHSTTSTATHRSRYASLSDDTDPGNPWQPKGRATGCAIAVPDKPNRIRTPKAQVKRFVDGEAHATVAAYEPA